MPRKSDFDARRPRLPGELNKPIYIPEPPQPTWVGATASEILLSENPIYDEQELKDWQSTLSKTFLFGMVERLAALREHYKSKGVDISDWSVLCLHIVKDFVPAFDVQVAESKRSRKDKWSPKMQLGLYLEVERELESQKRKQPHGKPSVSKACQKLQKDKKWQHVTPATLENRFIEVQSSPFVEMYKHALARAMDTETRNMVTAAFSDIKQS